MSPTNTHDDDGDTTRRPSRAPSVKEPAAIDEKSGLNGKDSSSASSNNEPMKDELGADWEGPDDPGNPKKCVSMQHSIWHGTDWSIKLVLCKEMGCNPNCFPVHIRQPSLLQYDSPRFSRCSGRVSHYKQRVNCNGHFSVRPCVW